MIRLLIRATLLLVASAIGLLVAKLTLDDMTINFSSFIEVTVIFTILQTVLSPFIAKVSARNAPALLGGIGLISTVVALIVTSLVSDGLTITGLSTWAYASLIVWLVTMIVTLLLPIILVKFGVHQAAERRN